ncbi:MAG: formate dehydrogenase accessory sulfurtransferase FdhD [Pseudomonadota bacterium]|nr:formate dehydrogenase accessory sulfurtransferase FdhD [Pseudomonadota bacterium]
MTSSTIPPLRSFPALRVHGAQRHAFDDSVIQESAIALVFNGIAFAVMMATPCDLEDFALGFSLSEGVVASRSEWRFIEARSDAQGITLEMHIPQTRFDALQLRRRNLAGNSACGLCGAESLRAALRPLATVKASEARFSASDVHNALDALAQAQALNRASGGVHAAGFAHEDGLLVREDVGRHTALDKLIGARARAGVDAGFVVITSRASYELVHKTASVGIELLASVSAPTSAAIELAQQCGLTLIAFARDQRMNLYTYPERLVD